MEQEKKSIHGRFVYGVYGDDDFRIERQLIQKDTPKQIILKRPMWSYGFRKRLLKEKDHIAYTPQDAVRYFVQEKLAQIEHLQVDIDRLNDQIDQARGLLDGC